MKSMLDIINKDVTLKIRELEAKLKRQYTTEKPKNIPKEFQCKQCDFKSEKSFELELHIKNTHEEQTFKCKMCDKIFGMKWRLKNMKKDMKHPLKCAITIIIIKLVHMKLWDVCSDMKSH